MNNEKIAKINKLGKIGHIISKIILVCMIIAVVATGTVGIVALCVPNDAATVKVDGTAQIEIGEKYLNLGKMIIDDVNNGMTEEGQTLTINGNDYECVSINAEDDRISIDYSSDEKQLTSRSFATVMLGACIECVNSLVLIIFVVALCKAIKNCTSPFEQNVIKRMKSLSIALIPWFIIQGISRSITASAFTHKIDFDLNIDLSTVIVVLIVIALIYVFRYGADLQQEADETL